MKTFHRFNYLWTFLFALPLVTSNAYSYAGDDDDNEREKKEKLFMFQGPGAEPWVTDGSAEGTKMIDVYPGGTSFAYGFTRFKGNFYFHANDGVNGFELWKSDGTPEGTKLVKDINPGMGSSFHYRFAEFVAYKGALYFQANDGVHGFELWKTDGTEAGTTLVEDIHTLSPAGNSNPGRFTVMNEVLYFSAYHGLGGQKLRRFDGTPPSRLVNNNDVVGVSTAPDNIAVPFTVLNGQLYLSARDTQGSQYALWKTDGTFAGSVLIKNLAPFQILAMNNTVYFGAYDTVNGSELWKTDGTTEGTVLVKDIYPGVASSSPRASMAAKNILYFQAYEPGSGYELWKSDGTEAGTSMVKDISVESGGRFSDYHFSHFHVLKDRLYFVSKDNVNGQRLWKTDGSAEGTVLLSSFYLPENFTVLKKELYFTATRSSEFGLWKTNGTPEGTVLVKRF